MARSKRTGDSAQPSVFEPLAGRAPLAARMRPRTLAEVAGQQHLLAPGRALRESIESGDTGSILFWGPPGTGKTTIARLIAQHVKGEFVPFSAVTEGIPRLREIVSAAESRMVLGTRTILFMDEIHRFNRAQQDALLPHVESGALTLVGATTENPSFEINGALLSRMRVYVLESLSADDIVGLLQRAAADTERGLGGIDLTADALNAIATESDGDARRALTILEAAANLAAGKAVTPEVVKEAAQLRFARYDKSGEEHFNLISAYHKALRGSDADGSLYWLARILQGGEDPLYVLRRMVRFATEDVGLADPRALEVTIAARDAYQQLGSPEGELAIAEACVYLATAPKSNRVYEAWKRASAAAAATPAAPVPKHIRNAPTALMKELDYGKGYEYAHNVPEAYIPQEYLPDEVRNEGVAAFYEPSAFGFEKDIAKRMAWWAELRARSERASPG
ncbi:MAG: replication-associated recombination protein A [Gemmatimonadota bacterium]|nr:replication-associated recombination protein A [Gemmatimonadota bacterium]